MSLADYQAPTNTHEMADGQKLVIRGLSTEDIVLLVQGQGDTLRDLYKSAINGEFTEVDTETLVQLVLDEAPVNIGMIIAFGCGEPEAWKNAMSMPVDEQVTIIEKIIDMTFKREGGVKKVLEIIFKAMDKVSGPATLNP